MIVISLGAGVQSTALLLMSVRGVLPKIDHAVFADTGWEPQAVYAHLEWLKSQAAKAGIPLHVVSKGNLRADYVDSRQPTAVGRLASIPLFVLNPDGSKGLLRRQCTHEYKIAPIHKFIRTELLGLRPRQRGPKDVVVEQWFGISADERDRMKASSIRWVRHVYPFCGQPHNDDLFPEAYTRQQCVAWLRDEYPDHHVPRSACIGCPFHTNHEWRRMRREDPVSWADAVEFDSLIRTDERSNNRMRGTFFLHRSCRPLSEADLGEDDVESDRLASPHGFRNECQGMCGV